MSKKEIILIVALSIIAIFYFPILRMMGLVDDPPPAEQVETTETENSTPVSRQPFVETNNNAGTDYSSQSSNPVINQPQSDSAVVIKKADSIYINTGPYKIIMSSLGGGPVSINLNEYSYRDGRSIDMLSESDEATPEFSFAGGTFKFSSIYFSSDLISGEYYVETEPLIVNYSYKIENGGLLNKKYIFYPDRYDFDLVLSISDPSKFGFQRKYQAIWNTPTPVTEPQPKTDYELMEAVAMQSDSRLNLDDFEDDKLNQTVDGDTKWAGVRSKYFCAVIIPRSDRQGSAAVAYGSKGSKTTVDGTFETRSIRCGMEMEFSELLPINDSFTVFVGAMDYNKMSGYDIGLEDMLDIGTMPFIGWIIKPFAIAILWLLPLMYTFIPNYGIVIILFALLVKLITLPLSMKSFKSMQAMKDIQPKMEELKKKHKKNPQALNKEMMKLYKEHGVNPMSGCLPMLPQMPLFFAMFSVFRATILLRDAPFFWFIDDLSRGASGFTDPYILLVIFMIAAQFVSQKLTMASNQQNKALIYIMPLFMGFIFYSFAAGLVLYWACFSIFSLIDYFLFKRGKSKEIQSV